MCDLNETEYKDSDGSAKVFVGRPTVGMIEFDHPLDPITIPAHIPQSPYLRSISKQQKLANEVVKEMVRAQSLFAPIHSLHEALGVIEEEFEEFKKEVFAFNLAKGRDTRSKARVELIQLAAMALRTIFDTIDDECC